MTRTQMVTFMDRQSLFMHWLVHSNSPYSGSVLAVTFWSRNVTTLRIHCTVDSYMHLGMVHLTWQTFPILSLFLKTTRFITKLTARGTKRAVFVQFTREQITCLHFKEKCSSTVAFGEGLMLYNRGTNTDTQRERFKYPQKRHKEDSG